MSSIEQGNSLYRNIVKKMFDERAGGTSPRSDTVRAARWNGCALSIPREPVGW